MHDENQMEVAAAGFGGSGSGGRSAHAPAPHVPAHQHGLPDAGAGRGVRISGPLGGHEHGLCRREGRPPLQQHSIASGPVAAGRGVCPGGQRGAGAGYGYAVCVRLLRGGKAPPAAPQCDDLSL